MGLISNYMVLNEDANCSIEVNHMDHLLFETKFFSYEKCFLLLLLVKGTISCTFKHNVCSFRGPCFICFNENDVFQPLESSCDVDLYAIRFTKNLVGSDLFETIQLDKSPLSLKEEFYMFRMAPFMASKVENRCVMICEKQLSQCVSSCQQLEQTIEGYCNKADTFAIMFHFEQLLAALTAAVNGYESEPCVKPPLYVPNDFRKIQDYIDKHLNESLTLEKLSKSFFVSVSSIERKFATYCGMTFKSYVSLKRFELAKQQLAHTNLTHKEIAANVGFSYTQSFCAFFKSQSGMSPRQYRKSVRK